MSNVLTAMDDDLQSGGNNDAIRKPKNDLLPLNTKHPETVRFVPIPGHNFFYAYRVIWVSLHTKDGSKTFSTMLTFPHKNPGNDKLMSVLQKIIHINYDYRDKHKGFTGDVIHVQYKKPNGPRIFPAQLRPMYALEVVKVENGKEDTLPSTMMPKVQIMSVPKTVFKDIRDAIMAPDQQPYLDAENKQPYPLDKSNPDPMHIRWITNDKTMAFRIQREPRQGAQYQFIPQPLTMLPPLPKQVYDRDKKGNFKFIDDPSYIYEPSKTRDPDFYKIALNEMEHRLDEYKESHGGGNPYAQSGSNQNQNPSGNQSSMGSQQSGTSDNGSNADPFSANAINRSDTSNGPSSYPFDSGDNPFASPSASSQSSNAPVSSQAPKSQMSSSYSGNFPPNFHSTDSSSSSTAPKSSSASQSSSGMNVDSILNSVNNSLAHKN